MWTQCPHHSENIWLCNVSETFPTPTFQVHQQSIMVDVTHPWPRFSLTPHRTLLRLHNLRAFILILICLTTACEIGRACLLMTHTTYAASSYAVESVLFFLIASVSSGILLRVIEVRKNKSGETIKCLFLDSYDSWVGKRLECVTIADVMGDGSAN